MRILLVEDNSSFGEILTEKLAAIGQTAWIVTESEFLDMLPQIEHEPPDVAIIDLMLRWDLPSRDPRPFPKEFSNIYTAGIRCAQRLQSSVVTRHVPVIIYSVLDAADLEDTARQLPNVRFLSKSSDANEVIDAIHQMTKRG